MSWARLSDAEYSAEIDRRLRLRALERDAARWHWRLACRTALALSCALNLLFNLLLWEDRESVGTMAISVLLCFPILLPLGWVGVAAFYWTVEKAEDAWDLFFGED